MHIIFLSVLGSGEHRKHISKKKLLLLTFKKNLLNPAEAYREKSDKTDTPKFLICHSFWG